MSKFSQILTPNFYASELIGPRNRRPWEIFPKIVLVSCDIPKINLARSESP